MACRLVKASHSQPQLPEDYSNEKFAGKEAHYTTTLHKVEDKELPELDDAFADAGQQGEYQTMEDHDVKQSATILLENKQRAYP